MDSSYPSYYELTFSTDSGGCREYFRVFVELNDCDKDSLRFGGEPGVNTREIVERVGILDLLPEGINDDWVRFGRVLGRDSRPSWDVRIDPLSGTMDARCGS